MSDDGITFHADRDAQWACGAAPVYCSEPYVSLARTLAPDPAALDACAADAPVNQLDLGAVPPPFDPWAADDLRADLVAGMDLGWLLEGLAERPLEVVLVEHAPGPQGRTWRLLASDPIVGTMQWKLRWPGAPARSLPAVIGLPGHPRVDDPALELLDTDLAGALVEAGYLLAVPSTRAYDAWYAESEAGAYLLCAGSSLMALRHYETLLLDRFLRALGVTDVSLVGHSGGSIALNALVRHDWRWRAAVSDLQSNYAAVVFCEEDEGPAGGYCLLDEVDPHLSRRFPQINDEGLVERRVPWLLRPYGYPAGPGPVLEFLAAHAG